MLGARGTARHRGGHSRHRAPAEAARAFSSGCSGGAAASIWAAAAFTPRRFASVKLLARASFRHHGVCSQTRTRQMLSGGWGADAGCTEAGRQGRPRPRARPCRAGEALSARASVQGLTCHRKRQCRGRFRCLSPRSAQLPVPRLRRSPRGGVCLPSRRGAAASPVRSFRGWCVASLKAPREQLLALEEFFTRSRKILL